MDPHQWVAGVKTAVHYCPRVTCQERGGPWVHSGTACGLSYPSEPRSTEPELLAFPSMATAPTGPARDNPPFQPVAAVAAWVLPGAGHLLLGHTRRAILISVGVLGLFATGLFIGGISCVDRKESFFWFLGQALTGPVAIGVDYVHQSSFKGYDPLALDQIRTTDDLANLRKRAAAPFETLGRKNVKLRGPGGTVDVEVPSFRAADASKGEGPPYTRSLGRANELGTLFCTIAGFLNLICVVDAAWRRRADDPRAAVASTPRAAAGAQA